MAEIWRKCSVCKKPIPQGSIYQKCSISSCRKSVFCSVDCWAVHDSVMGHKSAWAEEERAPFEVFNPDAPRRRIVTPKTSSNTFKSSKTSIPKDVLIVVSKLKAYVKARADMNTSGDVSEVLSEIVRRECDKAMEEARKEGRKTLMGRDFK